MVQIVLSSLVLGMIHALIPNHWLPLIAIGKTEKWTIRETLSATLITGFAHTLSTIVIGIFIGFIGLTLSHSSETITHIIAPSILIIMGIVYLATGLGRHRHHHSHLRINEDKIKDKSKIAILATLSLAMFLSPCIEIEAYYFKAGTMGWIGILAVSLVYTLTTVTLMVILVYVGMKGVNKIRTGFLEHHNRTITGAVLIIIGLSAFFIE